MNLGHSRSHKHGRHSGEELDMSTNKSRNEDFSSLSAYHHHLTKTVKQPEHSQPQYGNPQLPNQLASQIGNQFANQFPTNYAPALASHFSAGLQPHLFHYSQLNAQELDLTKPNSLTDKLTIGSLPASLQPLINVASLKQQPVDLARVISPALASTAVLQGVGGNLPSASNLQQANLQSLQNANLKANLTPSGGKAIAQNTMNLGQKSAAFLYGLTGLALPNQSGQLGKTAPSFDHRAASALDNKASKTGDKRDIESFSLHSCGPALMSEQPSRSNLYFGAIDTSSLTLEQLNQLNQMSQLNQQLAKRPLSPNRSPLYLVHQQNLGRSAGDFEPAEPKRSNKKESKESAENERLLNEIQQLKENLKRMESEKETLTSKLNRNEAGLAVADLQAGKSERSDRPVDKLDKAGKAERHDKPADKADRRDRKERAERIEKTKTDKTDKNDKIVNKDTKKLTDTQERKRIKAPETAGISDGREEELRPADSQTSNSATTASTSQPATQLNVSQSGSKPISSGQQIETRLDIEEDFSYEEDSERNKETII